MLFLSGADLFFALYPITPPPGCSVLIAPSDSTFPSALSDMKSHPAEGTTIGVLCWIAFGEIERGGGPP